MSKGVSGRCVCGTLQRRAYHANHSASMVEADRLDVHFSKTSTENPESLAAGAVSLLLIDVIVDEVVVRWPGITSLLSL